MTGPWDQTVLGGNPGDFNLEKEGWVPSMCAGPFWSKEAKRAARGRLDLSKPSLATKKRRDVKRWDTNRRQPVGLPRMKETLCVGL